MESTAKVTLFNTCRHSQGVYSVAFEVTGAMISLSNRNYGSNLDVFSMSRKEMYRWAEQLITEANKLEDPPEEV